MNMEEMKNKLTINNLVTNYEPNKINNFKAMFKVCHLDILKDDSLFLDVAYNRDGEKIEGYYSWYIYHPEMPEVQKELKIFWDNYGYFLNKLTEGIKSQGYDIDKIPLNKIYFGISKEELDEMITGHSSSQPKGWQLSAGIPVTH